MDLLVAAAGLFVLSPLLLGIGLLVVLTSGWPALYLQPRTGLGGVEFRIVKFRTMVRHAERLRRHLESSNEAPFPAFKMRDDPRVTKIGAWLRRSSLDELPQLWNVLVGNMSLVGPRPLPVAEAANLDVLSSRRATARPGITGTWQVSNRHGASITMKEWIASDLDYIDHWSMHADLMILLKTIPAVLRMTGQ